MPSTGKELIESDFLSSARFAQKPAVVCKVHVCLVLHSGEIELRMVLESGDAVTIASAVGINNRSDFVFQPVNKDIACESAGCVIDDIVCTWQAKRTEIRVRRW